MDCGNYSEYYTFIKKEKPLEIKNTIIYDHFGMLSLYNLETKDKNKINKNKIKPIKNK